MVGGSVRDSISTADMTNNVMGACSVLFGYILIWIGGYSQIENWKIWSIDIGSPGCIHGLASKFRSLPEFPDAVPDEICQVHNVTPTLVVTTRPLVFTPRYIEGIARTSPFNGFLNMQLELFDSTSRIPPT
jgi:hypothetical protein